jgi:SM-20-related protein
MNCLLFFLLLTIFNLILQCYTHAVISAINLHDNFNFLSTYKWCKLDIDKEKALQLKECAVSRLKNFKPGTAGLTADIKQEIRNDRIFWLSSETNDLHPIEKQTLMAIDELRLQMRDFFRFSLDEFECHLSYYAPGGHYVRHKDSTSLYNKRILSFVIYLNEFWKTEDGGQITGYDNLNNEIFKLEPEIGNMIIFFSDLEHEVISSKKDRFALAGWIRKK